MKNPFRTRSIQTFAMLLTVVAIAGYFAVSLNQPSRASSAPSATQLTDNRETAPNIGHSTTAHADTAPLPFAPDPSARNQMMSPNPHTADDTAAPPPSEQQLKNQTFLEQKVDGYLPSPGPMISEILRSDEFRSLTNAQRRAVLHRLEERINRGELRLSEVFP